MLHRATRTGWLTRPPCDAGLANLVLPPLLHLPAVLPVVMHTFLLLQVTCRFNLKLIDSATGLGISTAAIAGSWTSASGVPALYTVSGSTSSSGSITFKATKTVSASAGNACTFTVNTVTKAGYTMDPTSTMAGTLGPW